MYKQDGWDSIGAMTMARTRRKRRTEDQVRALALELAKSGPFAPGELAEKAGFSGNRARQVLESLGEKKKLVILDQRKSSRGKPANLWGFPGTKVTDADRAARPGTGRKVRSVARRATSGVTVAAKARPLARVTSPLDPGLVVSLRRVLDRLSVHGFEIEGPAGLTFSVRLGGGVLAKPAAGTGKGKRRRSRRRSKAVKAAAPVAETPKSGKTSRRSANAKRPPNSASSGASEAASPPN